MFVAFERRLDPGDLHVLWRNDAGLATALARLDFANAHDDVGFELVELFLADLAELEAHLRVEQPLAQHAVVVQLGLDRCRDLVEDEANTRDDQRIDDQHLVGAFELQPDVDEVVGRPRAGVLEGELLVLLPDLLDLRVERLLHFARDQEGSVHDHAVADRLVRPRRDRDIAQRAEDLRDIALGPRLQRRVDEAPVLHAREVGRTLLRRDLALEAADVFILVFDLADDLVAIPQHLQPELELVLHLVQHVAERVVGRAQQLHDVVVGLEHRAERHRDDRVLLHDGLVDALVREHVLASRILDDHRRVRDHRADVLVVDRVDLGRIGPESQRAEAERLLGADDAVDVLALAAVFALRRRDLDPFELAARGLLARRLFGGRLRLLWGRRGLRRRHRLPGRLEHHLLHRFLRCSLRHGRLGLRFASWKISARAPDPYYCRSPGDVRATA